MSFLQQKGISTFNETDLGYYLAGLIEGDGYFLSTSLQITYHLKDQIAAEKLQKVIGFGKFYRRKSQAADLKICTKKKLQKVLQLTNGRFVGPFKINQLQKHHYEERFNIKLLPSTEVVSFENTWLACFFEADGFTNIKIQNNSKMSLGKSTELSIGFGQKDAFLLNLIAQLFENQKVTAVNRKATLERPFYHGFKFVVTSQKVIPLWLDYFNFFHLQGRKYSQILKVQQCFKLMAEKKHLTKEGLEKILVLQKELRETELF